MNDEKYYGKFMETALQEAKLSLKEGNKGYGALIVKSDKILAQSHDTEVIENDPTAHAEINVIKKAFKNSGRELQDCTLISTHEPCPMCMSVIIWAKIPELVYSVSIEDSIKLGRDLINISSEEIKLRSNSNILIKGAILKQKCLKLYNPKIRVYVKRFRQASADDLKKYETELLKKRKKWFLDNKPQIDKLDGSEVEKAYKLLLMKLDINEDEAPIINRSDNKLVFHSRNFCPSLEACKILDLDTKVICKAIFEESTNEFIKMINPKLQFTRNYEKIRPYKDYCEEIITLIEK